MSACTDYLVYVVDNVREWPPTPWRGGPERPRRLGEWRSRPLTLPAPRPPSCAVLDVVARDAPDLLGVLPGVTTAGATAAPSGP
jgi:hypothetical protein